MPKNKSDAVQIPEGTPDAQAVNKKEDRVDLYESRKKVYPRRVYGKYRMLKWLVMGFALAVYYGLPWLRWDRGEGFPDQAVLIDMPARKAYMFGIEIWSQEVYYVTGLLVLASLTLFLMTSVAGRVWCGYLCPQTVWTDLFVHVERWIQGDRAARIRLDKAPWSLSKIFKKVSTHAAWLVISLLTGGAMILYFHDAPETLATFFTGEAGTTEYLFAGLLTFFTYLLGGLAREQVCIYMCPWPRIQGALVDENSLLVTYDKSRGEDRGKFRKGDSFENRGHCIDCNQCVAVCPMGIDIRDGFQLECIQCALCVDACNDIMEKMNLEPGLVRYAPTHFADTGGKSGTKAKVLRPRVFVYMGLIAVVGVLMLGSLLVRADFSLHVNKDRNPLFVTLSDGHVRNGYDLHLINKQHTARPVKLALEGTDGLLLQTPYGDRASELDVVIPADDVLDVRLFALLPRAAVDAGYLDRGKGQIYVLAKDSEGTVLSREAVPIHGPIR